jgi:hypothetical protein
MFIVASRYHGDECSVNRTWVIGPLNLTQRRSAVSRKVQRMARATFVTQVRMLSHGNHMFAITGHPQYDILSLCM